MSDDHRSRRPTDGLTYDPAEEQYWDPRRARTRRSTRVFEICHGCRMCFKYCDSFPTLFALHRRPARRRRRASWPSRRPTRSSTPASSASCARCSARTRRATGTSSSSISPSSCTATRRSAREAHGISLRDACSAIPTAPGRLARASLGLANAMNRVALHRWFLEKVARHPPRQAAARVRRQRRSSAGPSATGHDRDGAGRRGGALPDLLRAEQRAARSGATRSRCCEQNRVDVRCVSGARVLRHAGLGAAATSTRCGARRRRNLEHAACRFVERGREGAGDQPDLLDDDAPRVPELVAPEDRARAQKLAAAVRIPSEFLWSIRDEPRFNTDFKSTPGERSPTTRPATCARRPSASRAAICCARSRASCRRR